MPGQQAYFGMITGPGSQAGHVRAKHQAVQPGRCEVELSVGGQGVGALEQPAIAVLDYHPTVPARMPEEWDQIHLGCEGQPDSIEPKPLIGDLLVEQPCRAVDKISGVVTQLGPVAWVQHGFHLTPVGVDLGVGEIGQTPGVIKMEMSHNDMANCFRPMPEASQLANGGVFRVGRDAKTCLEEAQHARRAFVIVQSETGIYQDQPLVSID